jgi:hypothetical protein
MICRLAGVLAGLVLIGAAAPVLAAPITFNGSDTEGRSAKVTFEVSGNNLIVRLKNTSMADVGVPNQVLTGVFFNVAGNPLLTRTSAVLGSTSHVVNGPTPLNDVVGGEWAYRNGLNQYSANSALSSTGLGLFGSSNRFPGSNLNGPDAPDGLQYGITSMGDNPTLGNNKVTSTPLIKDEVIFTLGNWTLGDPTPKISNVTFQYGTDLSEPSFAGRVRISQVPEPSTLLLFGVAGVIARRFRRARN